LVRVAPDAERPADARSPLVDLTRCVAWIVKPVEHSLFGVVGEARLLRTPGGAWITHFANHAIGGRDRTYSTPDDELVGWWLANPAIEPPADVAAMLAGMDATARPSRVPFRPFRRAWAFLSGRLMEKSRDQSAAPEPAAPEPAPVVASEAPATVATAAPAVNGPEPVGPASEPEPATPKRTRSPGKLDDRATALFMDNPSLTSKQLAGMLGCDASTLRNAERCPKLAKARESLERGRLDYKRAGEWRDRDDD